MVLLDHLGFHLSLLTSLTFFWSLLLRAFGLPVSEGLTCQDGDSSSQDRHADHENLLCQDLNWVGFLRSETRHACWLN